MEIVRSADLNFFYSISIHVNGIGFLFELELPAILPSDNKKASAVTLAYENYRAINASLLKRFHQRLPAPYVDAYLV